MKLRLFHYWRSSASWRVRWAFALKNISFEPIAVSLLNGESESPEHLKRNPLGYVPALEIDGNMLIESLAIIEWAEEIFPTPSLLPGASFERARIRQLAELINADTHPLQNLSTQILHTEDAEKRKLWAQHWIKNGLQAYETLVAPAAGKFSFGDQLTLADLCLVPQVYNAIRFEVDLTLMPTVHQIYKNALETESCQAAHPERFNPG